MRKSRLQNVLQAYRDRPADQADQSLWSFVAAKDPALFSHHPATPDFREHVWRIGGLYFCKGCVVTFLGALFGAGLFAATGWLRWFTAPQMALIFVLLLLPTVVTAIFRWPRWCRHGARFLLGILLVSAFLMLFVTDSWIVRGIIVATYFGAKIPLERKRNREHQSTSST